MNKLSSPSHSPRHLNPIILGNQDDENTTTNYASRDVKHSTETTTFARTSLHAEDSKPEVAIKNKELTTTPRDVLAEHQEQPMQKNARSRLARERLDKIKQRNEETKEMLQNHSFTISASIDECLESIDKTENKVQQDHELFMEGSLRSLNELEKIHEAWESGQQLIDEALKVTQRKIISTECEGKKIIHQLENSRAIIKEIVADIHPVSLTQENENAEIDKLFELSQTGNYCRQKV